MSTKDEESKSEPKKEWKPSGQKLEGKALEEHLKAFSDIEESIKLCKEVKKRC